MPQLLLLKKPVRRNSARAYRYAFRHRAGRRDFPQQRPLYCRRRMYRHGRRRPVYSYGSVATHKNMDFPGHKHATLYNIYKIEPAVKKLLLSRGIKLLMADPAVKTEYEATRSSPLLPKSGLRLTADAFVDVSGSSAMPLNCNKHGNAAPCVSCAATASAPASASPPSPEWKNGQQKNLQGSAP